MDRLQSIPILLIAEKATLMLAFVVSTHLSYTIKQRKQTLLPPTTDRGPKNVFNLRIYIHPARLFNKAAFRVFFRADKFKMGPHLMRQSEPRVRSTHAVVATGYRLQGSRNVSLKTTMMYFNPNSFTYEIHIGAHKQNHCIL